MIVSSRRIHDQPLARIAGEGGARRASAGRVRVEAA
jgi:hypothetical protein